MKHRPHGTPVIGLIGGIGSGKSHVARTWASSCPIAIVSGDAAGHEVLEDPTVKQQLREQFGDEAFDSQGRVDRRVLARKVFGASEEIVKNRRRLESIVHPRIRQRLEEQIASARRIPGLTAIVVDAALLLEAGWYETCDALVFVDAPWADRLKRVRATRGWSAEDLTAREASQLPLDMKRKEADYVLSNTQTESIPPLDRILADLFDLPARTH